MEATPPLVLPKEGQRIMHREIYERLKERAKEERLITYGEIAPLAQLDMTLVRDRKEIGRLLGEISTYEHSHGRPLLSAIVVWKDGDRCGSSPGPGFFQLRRELGLRPEEVDLTFWMRELKEMFRLVKLERQFHAAMLRIYTRARDEAHYTAKRFRRMVGKHGGRETARILLEAPGVSEGYTALWERRRLDLTVEALVLQPAWRGLFTEEELAITAKRLKDYGYNNQDAQA